MMSPILGWDVGGVNLKATRVERGAVRAVALQPFELQHDPARLVPLLGELAGRLEGVPGDVHAVTMTAELSQLFRTKREGVQFVLGALEAAFPGRPIHVYGTDGRFRSLSAARRDPLPAAAANWMATAALVARQVPDCLLVDVGTTTTDVIPIVRGAVAAVGRTDPERLASGELVYTGALRTPAEAVAREVPFRAGTARVSAEGFALMGDVHLWLGALDPRDYTVRAPDGRPATREFARERLARVICADRESLDDGEIDAIARALAEAQVESVAEAIRQVCARSPGLGTAVVTGLGDFIAARAARRAGLEVAPLAERLGPGAARAAPAAAVALLLEQVLDGRSG